MRILFVGMSESVHLARWIGQLTALGWDLHLYPSRTRNAVHPDMPPIALHGTGVWQSGAFPSQVRVVEAWPFRRGAYRADRLGHRLVPGHDDPVRRLARVIRRVRPDLIHCLEMQHGGYLLKAAADRLRGPLPPVVYSCWGNDIYFFSKQPYHRRRIAEFLGICDYLMADCERDLTLAPEFGFRGETLGNFPTPGGFTIDRMLEWRDAGAPSKRRTIAVKGYDHWAGRALVALRGLARAADLLSGYDIEVFSPSKNVLPVIEHIAAVNGLRIRALPASSHTEMLSLLGRSRIHLAVSISDGTPNTMLEAMVMGALPIQSDTVSTGEWIDDGVNGFLVPGEDSAAIEQSLRRALQDTPLVDDAARRNLAIARERIDECVVFPRVEAAYRQVVQQGKRV